MNALAHCAEALYAGPCEDASVGAALIGTWLPVVAENRCHLEGRTRLLEGAMHAGMALAERGLFLAHAMAQALGGRYGVSHGAMNALCLAPALRFNAAVVPDSLAALATALGVSDAPHESRSSPGSAASSASAIMESRKETFTRSQRRPHSAPVRAPTRGLRQRTTSRRSCARLVRLTNCRDERTMLAWQSNTPGSSQRSR